METDWWEMLREWDEMIQPRRRSVYADWSSPYHGNPCAEVNLGQVPNDEEHAFTLFVKGELSEERYLHWKQHFRSKRLTPEQERIQRIRNMPKIKQRMTRLKPWE